MSQCKKQFFLLAILLNFLITVLSAADETVSGKLTVDQDAIATALQVQGGISGKPLAKFVRDNGTGSAVSEIQIDAGGNNPEMSFTDYSTAGTWVMGLKNSDNSFRISQHSSLYSELNNYFKISNSGSLDILNSFYTSLGTILITPQNSTIEGGQLVLEGADSYAGWNIDSYQDKFRIFNGSGVPFHISGPGNVGIGTGSPTSKLTVIGSGLFNSGTTNTALKLQSSDANVFLSLKDAGTSEGNVGITGYNNRMYITTGGAERIRINPNGDVGIGTTSPSNKLEVNGTIRAKEIIVESTGWSDFVFAEDYELKSLSEVSAFIKENGRLPDIPSAEQVAENGISLGEMNASLLQKVEELTLHLIQLQGEVDQLKSKNP